MTYNMTLKNIARFLPRNKGN